MTDIGVIGGAGYVGLVTGVGLAALGHRVIAQDIDQRRLEMLRRGNSAVYEEGLEPILRQLIDRDQISFTDDQIATIRNSEALFIAVGTPSLADGAADLAQVISVAEQLRDEIQQYTVVVVKSTVPVGTIDVVVDVLSQKLRVGEDFDVVSNPEFLREGSGLIDFFAPSRIIVGSTSVRALKVLREIYEPLLNGNVVVDVPWIHSGSEIPYVETDPTSAQLTKYAANAYLATRISFINEIAGISEKVGGNIGDIVYGLGLDPRIGPGYLKPGIGFGGPCLDKDLRALITLAGENSYDPVMFNGVLQRNKLQMREVMNKIVGALGPSLYQRRIALLGLAFKEGTNDVRHSLSIRLYRALRDQGASVVGHDLLAVDEAKELEPELEASTDVGAVLAGAEVVVALNSEQIYADIDWSAVGIGGTADRPPHVIDTRGILDTNALKSNGITFDILGSTG
ncbi:MAG: UDP-glucose/GDP-mannose dehydrogenase family protein [Chloroflexi bacterium]|nr:UDP-glucose/GDP-mannose dehydrogenase family protein [Chloroflexota bacterium]MCI0804405.1 UDP-glucose/GDP-mannose dehydrogenase family protein [Chloroflexota bacterium]MCI0833399.1 UDP-glucose/GDP-mannose dehydrogenase family protein [Chloroflexota bacterium]MCI0835883.1 UDP-glucose/GDP-mannose dehydrogenase family protein [Chloroflexota bacterium]MCI0851442.1 UDP-glucose/GDP-mannose dehydrogenase family protein [Chloroflexota bacterium]